MGCLIVTKSDFFYISIAVGACLIEGKKVYCISPESPLGKAFKGLQAGEKIAINNNSFSIIQIL